MIGLLTGTIVKRMKNPLIINVGGVGYLVHVTDTLLHTLEADSKQTVYIHTHVREESFDLYGFLEESELVLYEHLLTVSGIGPKTALLVMEKGVPPIQRAILSGDVDFFTTVPRLGKKNAQKIIIELKNKLGGSMDVLLSDTDGDMKQVTDALISMGFKKHEIAAAIAKIEHSDETIEQKMRTVLKHLGK